MRSSGGGGGGGDDRILSRHLANEQHSTFRGINNNGANQNNGGNGQNDIAEHHRLAQPQQQHFSAAGIGGGGGGGTFDGLHPSGGGNVGGGRPNTMANLPLTLRRSMPAMNGGNGGPNGGGSSAGAAAPQSRHLSFCAHPVGEEIGEEEQQQRREDLGVTAENYEGKIAGGKTPETRNVDKIRCTSAHSYTSLSPSGSLVFHPSAAIQPTNYANPIANSSASSSAGPSAPVGGGGGFSSVVDTRQIQVFLKKREDSRATISTTMSEWSSTSATTLTPSEASVTHKMATNPPAGVPPAGPSMPPPSSSSVAGTSMAFKNSRKIFRSSDTRSSIFSVSSSLDSNKEERIIANFEHTPVTASSNRVVVLPRPQQPILAPNTQSLHVDYAAAGPVEGGGGMMDGLAVNGATERARSSSAELMSHRQSTSAGSTSQHHMSNATTVSAATAAGRRTSIDESKFGANAPSFSSSSSPPPLPLLSSSSWHSISDLNSARHSDSPTRSADGMGGHRMGGMGGGGGFAEGHQQGEKAEIWNSPPPARPQSQASNRRSNYLGELVWQVDETVYCGGIEAAQNQNLLCRLNIEYIVDLSGQEDDPTLANSRPRTEYPCLCPKRTAHSRMTMSIRVKDDSQQMLSRDARPSTVDTKAQMMEREEIIHYFEALIDLIRKARISQKKVLIHSLKGRNRAPAFVAAYLMHCNRQTRVQAINKISKMMSSMRPGTCISDTLQRALMRWQSILGIRAESSRLDTQQLNKMFAVKRTAWN